MIDNTEVKQRVKALAHRNAYRMKLVREYKTARVPGTYKVNIYADLTQIRSVRTIG